MADSAATPEALALAASRTNMFLGYEQRMLAANAAPRRLPVTIVSGFLGAGKTSLLRHVLANRLNLRVACAVSDLAAVNVDRLLVASDQTLFALHPSAATATAQGNGQDREWGVSLASAKGPPTGGRREAQARRARLQHGAEVFGVPSRSVSAFEEVIWQALQGEGDDAFDYLLVETSGTTDPSALIRGVQQRFGRMTRARLDSVVIVVDGDALASDEQAGQLPNDVAVFQLQCADVVVLNKVDLMTEYEIEVARGVIQRYAPHARVYETSHGQVYLPHVLDVAPPEGVHDAVSHESVQPHWICGRDDAARRLRLERTDADSVGTMTGDGSGFGSVVYEQASAVPLAALHDYIRRLLPDGVLRAKGVVHLAEAPRDRFVVQLSGKKRLEIENTGVWRSTPGTQFVVIGTEMDDAKVKAQLEAAWKPSDRAGHEALDRDDAAAKKNASVAALEQDPRFEVVRVLPHAVQFRLQLPSGGVDAATRRHIYHVDRNELVRRLIHEVNARGNGALLVPVVVQAEDEKSRDQLEPLVVVAMAATGGGETTLLDIWSAVDARAEVIIREVTLKLAGCMCGF